MAALPCPLLQWPAGVPYHWGAGGTPGDNVECTSELCQLSNFWGIYPLAPHLSLAEGCVSGINPLALPTGPAQGRVCFHVPFPPSSLRRKR